jgi:hypothetical protein
MGVVGGLDLSSALELAAGRYGCRGVRLKGRALSIVQRCRNVDRDGDQQVTEPG